MGGDHNGGDGNGDNGSVGWRSSGRAVGMVGEEEMVVAIGLGRSGG